VDWVNKSARDIRWREAVRPWDSFSKKGKDIILQECKINAEIPLHRRLSNKNEEEYSKVR
jgi:hypothetical protein